MLDVVWKLAHLERPLVQERAQFVHVSRPVVPQGPRHYG